MSPKRFQKIVSEFYRDHKRDFPWRKTKDSYRILVSEIMLQQTQVDRVVPKYLAFLQKFPTFASLAKASTADVLKMWQGLGYNRRALALKSLSQIVTEKYRGKLPKDPEVLVQLPGIGQYTAAAVAAFAWNIPTLCIETNIRRVYIHHFFPDREGVSDKEIFPLIEKTIDQQNPREWYYALMDYGSSLPKKIKNPNRRSLHYAVQSKFEGSNRQLRGQILKALMNDVISVAVLKKSLNQPLSKLKSVLVSLEKEGFIRSKNNLISLS
jgi:A/G-specific adenine glycosylase